MLRVFCSMVIEQLVVCTDLRVYFIHVLLNNSWHSVIVRVACFSCLEEYVRILCGPSFARMIWIQRMFTECVDRIQIYQIFQIFIIPCLNLLDLMGCTESIEKVDKWKASLDCRTVGNRRQVHDFLNTGFTKHCTSCLTACVYVRVISENGERMACKRTGRYIEYTRKLFTCNLIQVRDHQKKSLRCCVSSCQSACCKRTVYSTCCSGLRLHLRNLNFLSKNVLSSLGSPLISSFCHNR